MEHLSYKQVITIVVLTLMISITPVKKVHAIPMFRSCDLPSSFNVNWLATGKTALTAAGYSPNFNDFNSSAIIFRNPDNPDAIYFFLGDSNAKITIDTSTQLQYGSNPGTTAQIYRIIYNISGGVIQAARIGNGFTTFPASDSSLYCVQGAKGLQGSSSALSDVTYRFPASDGLTPFGGASFTQPSSGGAGGPPTTELTVEDQKIIAILFSIWLAVLCLKPFVWRNPRG